MINGLVGSPGSGKTYEAVVYHVLPAVQEGRKVRTNLPLNLEEFERRCPGASALIEILEPTALIHRRFVQVEDYLDPWRHPESNQGPLLVIDEAHHIFRGKVSPDLLSYFAVHRHHGVDILLVTQTWRQVHAEVRDMVQLNYRVRKATALGSSKSYIRKVQDGIRGDVTNQDIRRYDPKHYPLYKSHTLTNKAVLEAAAKDVRPFWRHWSVQLLVMVILFIIYAGFEGWLNPFRVVPKVPPASPAPVSILPSPAASPSPPPSPPALDPALSAPPPAPKPVEPFAGHGLHIDGAMAVNDTPIYRILVSQAGQVVAHIRMSDLRDAGYIVIPRGRCVLELIFEGVRRFAVCDAPKVSISSVASAR